MPIIGQNQSPCDAATKIVPINATVHVKEVSVKVNAMNKIPAYPSELSLSREKRFNDCGISIS